MLPIVSAEKAKAFAEGNGLSLVETSAKDNSNVEFAFQKLIVEIYQETVKKNMLDNDQSMQSFLLVCNIDNTHMVTLHFRHRVHPNNKSKD